MAMDMDSASSIPTELCSALQSFGEGIAVWQADRQYSASLTRMGATAKSDGVIDITVQYRQHP